MCSDLDPLSVTVGGHPGYAAGDAPPGTPGHHTGIPGAMLGIPEAEDVEHSAGRHS